MAIRKRADENYFAGQPVIHGTENDTLLAEEEINAKGMRNCIATGRRHGYGFFGDGRERLITDDMSLLPYSTEEAGGFVGCTIGMYASANGQDSSNYADFAWFVQNAV